MATRITRPKVFLQLEVLEERLCLNGTGCPEKQRHCSLDQKEHKSPQETKPPSGGPKNHNPPPQRLNNQDSPDQNPQPLPLAFQPQLEQRIKLPPQGSQRPLPASQSAPIQLLGPPIASQVVDAIFSETNLRSSPPSDQTVGETKNNSRGTNVAEPPFETKEIKNSHEKVPNKSSEKEIPVVPGLFPIAKEKTLLPAISIENPMEVGEDLSKLSPRAIQQDFSQDHGISDMQLPPAHFLRELSSPDVVLEETAYPPPQLLPPTPFISEVLVQLTENVPMTVTRQVCQMIWNYQETDGESLALPYWFQEIPLLLIGLSAMYLLIESHWRKRKPVFPEQISWPQSDPFPWEKP